jgi:hypothetical protein
MQFAPFAVRLRAVFRLQPLNPVDLKTGAVAKWDDPAGA